MIRTLQRLGYVLVAIVVFCILAAIVGAIATVIAAFWIIGLAGLVIFFIASCIKAYFEQSVPNRKDEGSERGSS
jgi:type IV secretory pathway TrbD component